MRGVTMRSYGVRCEVLGKVLGESILDACIDEQCEDVRSSPRAESTSSARTRYAHAARGCRAVPLDLLLQIEPADALAGLSCGIVELVGGDDQAISNSSRRGRGHEALRGAVVARTYEGVRIAECGASRASSSRVSTSQARW